MSDSLRLPDVKPPCLNSPGTLVPGFFLASMNINTFFGVGVAIEIRGAGFVMPVEATGVMMTI